MTYPLTQQAFTFGGQTVQLLLPDAGAVRSSYQQLQAAGAAPSFPYWARLWPASIALCDYLSAQSTLIAGKKVVELAAGLGLPGLLAAHWAHEVLISDYMAEAVAVMQAAVALNAPRNICCQQLDWNHLPSDLLPDVLLLSDINYAPDSFDSLYSLLRRFLDLGTTIILATPQRLMARPFIDRLMPWCAQQEEIRVDLDGQNTFVSVLVLKKPE